MSDRLQDCASKIFKNFADNTKISFVSLFRIGEYKVEISGDVSLPDNESFANLFAQKGLYLERIELTLGTISSYLPGI